MSNRSLRTGTTDLSPIWPLAITDQYQGQAHHRQLRDERHAKPLNRLTSLCLRIADLSMRQIGRQFRDRTLAAICAAFLCLAGGAAQAENRDATSLVFETPYMHRLNAPGKLIYSFQIKTANKEYFGADFEDKIQIGVTQSKDGDGKKDLTIEMFTGERQRSIPTIPNVSGNSAIMAMLEWDLQKMRHYIPGDSTYFRNRVRQAFREKAQIEDAKFTYDGREVTGSKITIKPFLNDPFAAKMDIYQTKVYEFVMSDAVPGGLYQIHIYVPSPPGQEPASIFIDETMTLANYEETENKQ